MDNPSARVDRCIAAIKRLNPHPHCYAKARWDEEKGKYAFWYIRERLDDEEIKKHVLGKQIIGGVGADDQGLTSVVGIDIDAHSNDQKPATAIKRLGVVAEALDIPIMAHTSKSGKGAHIRTIFNRPVPTFMARALFVSLIIAAGLSTNTAVDKVWPPVSGIGTLAMPFNSRIAKECGGTVSINPITLQDLRRQDQLVPILEHDGMTLDDVERTLLSLGIRSEKDAIAVAGGAGKPARDVKEQVDGGVQLMLQNCEAVARLEREARHISYEFWFSMMTNFKPFIGGLDLFTEYSKLDPSRFNHKELMASWRAISGGPRRCANLDFGWQCSKIDICPAKSPAGLPFHIVRDLGSVAQEQAIEDLRREVRQEQS